MKFKFKLFLFFQFYTLRRNIIKNVDLLGKSISYSGTLYYFLFQVITYKYILIIFLCIILFRPIIHREALAAGRRKSSTPLRPVMDRSCGARRESGAQTDISALPAQWRSESYLAHKVAHTFTTLPSKFALPTGVAGRLRLSDKTREARRVMLSDISFTSMVPELSRSADHLCHDPHSQVNIVCKQSLPFYLHYYRFLLLTHTCARIKARAKET